MRAQPQGRVPAPQPFPPMLCSTCRSLGARPPEDGWLWACGAVPRNSPTSTPPASLVETRGAGLGREEAFAGLQHSHWVFFALGESKDSMEQLSYRKCRAFVRWIAPRRSKDTSLHGRKTGKKWPVGLTGFHGACITGLTPSIMRKRVLWGENIPTGHRILLSPC